MFTITLLENRYSRRLFSRTEFDEFVVFVFGKRQHSYNKLLDLKSLLRLIIFIQQFDGFSFKRLKLNLLHKITESFNQSTSVSVSTQFKRILKINYRRSLNLHTEFC